MSISFGSINTGLPKDIVKQIVDAERIPIQKMEERKEKFTNQKSLVGELIKLIENIKTNVNANQNGRSFRELKASYDEEAIDVTLDKTKAEPGSYQFEVGKLSQKSSAMSAGYESKDDEYLGVGYIQYFLPDGTTKDVYIDPENSSLEGIARLINSDPSNGMRAVVVNDGSGSDEPWRLIISLKDTGDEKLAEFPYFYFVDPFSDLYLERQRDAHDAQIKIDGFDIEVPENKTANVIPGATINLKKAKPGEEFTINITEDTAKIAEKFQKLIESINAVLSFIIEQNNLDKDSDTTRTLGGDITLQTVESRLRRLIFQPIQTERGSTRISEFGVTFQRTGLLELDDKRFEALVDKDYKHIEQFMTGWFNEEGRRVNGFFDSLSDAVNGLISRPNGILHGREAGIQSKIRQIDQQISDRQRMIDQKEKTLKDKFARLEGTISRIKNQGAGLAALQANTIDPVQQLGQTT